jgi:hypothetical protein
MTTGAVIHDSPALTAVGLRLRRLELERMGLSRHLRECLRQAPWPLSAGRAVDGDASGSDTKRSYPRVVAAGACLERGDAAPDV